LYLTLHATSALAFAPDSDTLNLCARRKLAPIDNTDDLAREILLSMLLDTARFEFPSYAELQSAIRIRMNIVTAARKPRYKTQRRSIRYSPACCACVKHKAYTATAVASTPRASIRAGCAQRRRTCCCLRCDA
jgi:hypothetical protein